MRLDDDGIAGKTWKDQQLNHSMVAPIVNIIAINQCRRVLLRIK
jgi:hypothetical protein